MIKETTIFISVWPLPGANEIDIGDRLYKKLDSINQTLPKGLSITSGFDGTLYMRNALQEIFITLAETILLVGIVVVVMMGSFRTALVTTDYYSYLNFGRHCGHDTDGVHT